ncbi:MAG: cyclopropane-fatty-acyl-phospholipid synthase family protein [Sulfuritalea sp.]|jgi:cyclopropane-fatty-acyl-phospholipid synthase|nr:cyclopropane-fatty-acyl-phospholipid synthase family protein [Sulfuritalea sp.]
MSEQQTHPASSSMPADVGYGARAPDSRSWPALEALVSSASRVLLTRMLASIGNPALQFVLWNGEEIPQRGDGRLPRIVLNDFGAVLKLAGDPQLRFGEMFTAGRLEVKGDLAGLLELIYRALPREDGGVSGAWQLRDFFAEQRNSPSRAKQNIHHHYDFGNDFYKLWLDQRMVYTCAYFPTQAMDLEAAQLAKMDLVCSKLRLKPGDRVIEAGCGWGALALHMAKHYGASVQAYNISAEQMAFARERARLVGLDGRVEFIEDDYRNVSGKFDAFVSVGMLEHVGPEYYEDLGRVIDRVLADHGRGLIHSIGRDYPCRLDSWTERHIFPEACPPSLSQMMAIFEPCGFSVLDVENLRLHYAKTLEHWLDRFEVATGTVEEMFNPAVARTWRLYLAGSLAAFRSGNMQLFQVLFSRTGDNRIPWTRTAL